MCKREVEKEGIREVWERGLVTISKKEVKRSYFRGGMALDDF